MLKRRRVVNPAAVRLPTVARSFATKNLGYAVPVRVAREKERGVAITVPLPRKTMLGVPTVRGKIAITGGYAVPPSARMVQTPSQYRDLPRGATYGTIVQRPHTINRGGVFKPIRKFSPIRAAKPIKFVPGLLVPPAVKIGLPQPIKTAIPPATLPTGPMVPANAVAHDPLPTGPLVSDSLPMPSPDEWEEGDDAGLTPKDELDVPDEWEEPPGPTEESVAPATVAASALSKIPTPVKIGGAVLGGLALLSFLLR